MFGSSEMRPLKTDELQTAEVERSDSLTSSGAYRQKSRRGKHAISAHVTQDQRRAVRQLALDLDVTIDELIRLCLSRVLVEQGRPPLI